MPTSKELAPQLRPLPSTRVSIFLGLALIALFCWRASYLLQALKRLHANEVKVVKLSSEMLYLEEGLANATSMAQVSGDMIWQDYYSQHLPLLDMHIREVLASVPEPSRLLVQERLRHARSELNHIVEQVFHRLRLSQRSESEALLRSAAYQAAKMNLHHEVMALEEVAMGELAKQTGKSERQLQLHTLGVIVLLLSLLAAWVTLVGLLRKHHGHLYTSMLQREEAEKDVRQKARILTQLAEHTPLALAVLDVDCNYLMTTRKWHKHVKKEGVELPGTNFFHDNPLDDESRQRVLSVLDGVPDINQGRLFHTSHGDAWYRWENHPWKHEDGRIGGMVMFFEDITERKRSEQSVLDAEARYRLLIANLPDYVLEVDTRGTIIFANRSLHLDDASEKPESLFDILPRENWSTFVRALECSEHEQQPQKLELVAQVGGEDRFFRFCFIPLRQLPMKVGKDGRVLLIVTDFTLEKRASEALMNARSALERRVKVRTAELEQANEDVRSFAYIISHDLRAPLVNIRGFLGELSFATELIMSHLDKVMPQLTEAEQQALTEAVTEDVPEAMSFIENSVSRMDQMISAVLKLSRLGRQDLKPELTNMDELVRDCLNNLAFRIEKEKISVTVAPLPSLPVDPIAMTQIFANILSNAVNYLQPGRPGRIAISWEEGRRETRFSVEDNGRGIAEDDIAKVFEIFRRVGVQSSKGEGMGMAYVKALVSRLGGKITCKSELGEGTTITFSIAN